MCDFVVDAVVFVDGVFVADVIGVLCFLSNDSSNLIG